MPRRAAQAAPAKESIEVWKKGVCSDTFHPRYRSDEMRARLSGGHPQAPILLSVGRLGNEKNLKFLKVRRRGGAAARVAASIPSSIVCLLVSASFEPRDVGWLHRGHRGWLYVERFAALPHCPSAPPAPTPSPHTHPPGLAPLPQLPTAPLPPVADPAAAAPRLVLQGILERTPGARLAFVGDGPAREELQRYFAGTPTLFMGMMHGEELSAAYASADVFVMPSETETLGEAPLPAQSWFKVAWGSGRACLWPTKRKHRADGRAGPLGLEQPLRTVQRIKFTTTPPWQTSRRPPSLPC